MKVPDSSESAFLPLYNRLFCDSTIEQTQMLKSWNSVWQNRQPDDPEDWIHHEVQSEASLQKCV